MQQVWSCAFVTLTATILTSGATPMGATCPSDVMTPATQVPCPALSTAAPVPVWNEDPFGQHPPSVTQVQAWPTTAPTRSGCVVSTPLSTSPTTIPAPV